MNHLAAFLDRRFASPFDPRQPKVDYFDVVQWGRRGRFTGLVMDDDIVVLDWKRLGSSRIRLSNMLSVGRCSVFRPVSGPPFPKEYVASYLAENKDNPFGIWNVLRSHLYGAKPQRLTQFPPLTYSKERQQSALDEMQRKAWAGDLICTFDRASGLSNLIRRLDWCMWSHCATYTGDGTIIEWTTSGCVESPFDRLRDRNLDVAVYRHVLGVSDEEQREFGRTVVKHAKTIVGIPGYSWGVVIGKAIAKNIRLLRPIVGKRITQSPSPAERYNRKLWMRA